MRKCCWIWNQWPPAAPRPTAWASACSLLPFTGSASEAGPWHVLCHFQFVIWAHALPTAHVQLQPCKQWFISCDSFLAWRIESGSKIWFALVSNLMPFILPVVKSSTTSSLPKGSMFLKSISPGCFLASSVLLRSGQHPLRDWLKETAVRLTTQQTMGGGLDDDGNEHHVRFTALAG